MTIERVESKVDPVNPNRVFRNIHKVETPAKVLLRTKRADPNSIDQTPLPLVEAEIIDGKTIALVSHEEGEEPFVEWLVGESINQHADDLTIGDRYRGKVTYRYRDDSESES